MRLLVGRILLGECAVVRSGSTGVYWENGLGTAGFEEADRWCIP